MTTQQVEARLPSSIARGSFPPLRVVHLLPNLSIGGMERLLVEMLRHTNRERVSPRVLCTGERGELADEAERLGVPVDALGRSPGRNYRLIVTLARWFRAAGTDVVHTHGPYAHFYGALAARLSGGTPLIHTKHGFLWPWTRRRHWQARLAGMLSTRVVAVSRDLAEQARSSQKPRNGRLEVLYNGIDTQPFEPRVGAEPGAPTAVMVARFSDEKDFETLLEATRYVVHKRPDFQLKLIGDGPLRKEMQSLATRLGVERAVEFMGNRHDVPARLSAADMFILSTRTEGMSISLLEAMAAGLPVVATSVGGNPEVIVEGETGFLVPQFSPEKLAEKIVWLLDHPGEAQAMGHAGRERVETKFDVRQTVKAYERLYFEVAGRSLPACDAPACEGHGE
jgi:glycosyltransferase involved in cell wall biosynthesis